MESEVHVFVTGATGFIGHRLALELARRGHHVRALTRSGNLPSPPAFAAVEAEVPAGRLDPVQGNVCDVASLRKAMDGCGHVYHLAGYAKNWAPEKRRYDDVNVQGFRNVLDVAREQQVERVVWTSTALTLQPTNDGTIVDEETPRTVPYFTDYERTKAEGEQLAREYAADGCPVVTVNPSRVYGPGHLTESNSLVRLIDMYNRGRMPFRLGAGRLGNYVFVDDVVQGMILAMERGRVGQRYLIGGTNATFRDFFQAIDRVSGKRHWQVTIRRPAAMVFAYFQLKRAEWFGIYPQITPGWVRVFLLQWACTSAKAERELGFQARSLEEGISQTYEWLQRVRSENHEP